MRPDFAAVRAEAIISKPAALTATLTPDGVRADPVANGHGAGDAHRFRGAIEWRTLVLAAGLYSVWLITTWCAAILPLPLLSIAGGGLLALHGSLQHETIHGHPTRLRWLNGMIGAVPLSLWLPYGHYRRTHLGHHATASITDPFEDPESRYLGGGRGLTAGLRRMIASVQSTLLGRLIAGPPLTISLFLADTLVFAVREPRAVAREWLPHLVGVSLVLFWLHLCGVSVWLYLIAFVYPGTALTLLRSFAEHRADADPEHRVAIVESPGLLGFLFLHNNLHAVHHREPHLPWYRIPAFYRRHRMALLEANGGLIYDGYGEIARRFLLAGHDDVVHPLYRGTGSRRVLKSDLNHRSKHGRQHGAGPRCRRLRGATAPAARIARAARRSARRSPNHNRAAADPDGPTRPRSPDRWSLASADPARRRSRRLRNRVRT